MIFILCTSVFTNSGHVRITRRLPLSHLCSCLIISSSKLSPSCKPNPAAIFSINDVKSKCRLDENLILQHKHIQIIICIYTSTRNVKCVHFYHNSKYQHTPTAIYTCSFLNNALHNSSQNNLEYYRNNVETMDPERFMP